MRQASAAVIITLLAGGAAYAQLPLSDLVEFARQERARREAQPPSEAPVLTTEAVERFESRVGRVTAESAPVTGETGDGDAPPTGTPSPAGDTDDPVAALADGRERVQALEDEEVRLQLEMNRLRGEFLAPVASQGDRDAAVEGMSATESRLEALRAELVEARALLAVLEEEAARETSAGAPSAAETAENR